MSYKNFWMGINSSLILLLFVYLMIVKDLNTRAYDKCIEVEKELQHQRELIDQYTSSKDTIVVNIKNYNYNYGDKREE